MPLAWACISSGTSPRKKNDPGVATSSSAGKWLAAVVPRWKPIAAPLEAPEAAADAIRAAFASYADEADGWVKGKGCLMCNTAVEAAALDPGAAKFVDAYIARVTAAFRHALANASAAGELAGEPDLDELAAFLMMSLIGVVALIRAQADPVLVRAASRVATASLD